MNYRGRFAPSPTGPLHFGSLVTAVASYLDARVARGEWLVRMEDIDTPRNVPGMALHILHTLASFGFQINGEVLWQSTREAAYQKALDQLVAFGAVFACGCSRKDVGGVYPGTCRNGLEKPARSWRLRVDDAAIEFEDRRLGPQREVLATSVGDFVLKRADGLWAYQLAVVVDDAFQEITHVVRGGDILPSTARQIYLQRRLGVPALSYLHLPVAVDEAGAKLSKQTKAPPISASNAPAELTRALRFLGQDAPLFECVSGAWDWAIANWKPGRIPHA